MKIILTGIVIVAILIAAILYVLLRSKSTPPQTIAPTDTGLPTPLPPLQTPTVIQPPPPGPQEQNPSVIATLFAERYGSFSTESNYQNLRDLYPQMTVAMRERTDAFIASNPLPGDRFQGTTTKALQTEVISQNDAETEIKVLTQRIESIQGNPQSRIYYQTATLRLIKQDLIWLIDDLIWKNEA